MAKSRSFRYQERSKEDVKNRANARGGNFDSFIKSKYKLYKVRDGKNLIRILPPTWDKATHYGYDIWVNYGIGVDNQSYLSLSKMGDAKAQDPLLEARREAEKEGDKKTAAALQPRQRILMWVIDRQNEDEGPQLWAAPFTVDKDIANLCFDEDTKEVIYIDDPEQGCDLRFYKEGTGLMTKYPPAQMRILKASPIHEDEKLQDEWLEYVSDNPVPDTLQFYDYDHIAATFNGQVRVNKDDDDDEDEKPRKRRASRDDDEDEKPRARRRAEPDDDEDDDPPPRRRAAAKDEDDEDEPDDKPKRTRTKLKPSDDDGDDAEDEDERPTKARRGATSRASEDEDEDEPAPKKGGSIRERLQRRRSGGKDAADDDGDDED